MTTMQQLQELPVQEKLQNVGGLWDSIASDAAALRPTPEQEKELDRRLDDLENNPTEGRPWEEVRAEIQSRL